MTAVRYWFNSGRGAMAEIVLEESDTISVVYGQGEPVPEYAAHPRVQWVPVNGRSPRDLI